VRHRVSVASIDLKQLEIFRPIAPMCRMHINGCFAFRLDPTAKNASAGKKDCMNAVCINKRDF
jgi:hypothetical protein